MFKLLTVPNPKLRIEAEPIDDFGSETTALIDGAIELMYAQEGAGLAAPQFGVHKKFFVMDIPESREDEESQLQVFINPEIISQSEEQVVLTEGCLSVPGVSAEVTRSKEVRLRYLDREFKSHERDFYGWQARCILHEYDHLVGKLYVDHLPPMKRKMLLKESARYQREQNQENQANES